MAYEELALIWDKYSDEIIHRFRILYNNGQRSTALRAGWPDMPNEHRPDFALIRSKAHKRIDLKLYNDILLYPHINLEDLCEPELFLLFLEGRCKHVPGTFAFPDLANADIQFGGHDQYPVSEESVMVESVMVLSDTRARFGKLVGRQELQADECPFHPSVGLSVLHLQAELYPRLLDATKAVLRGLPLNKRLLVARESAPTTFLQEAPEDWLTLSSTLLRGSFQVPYGMEFDRLDKLSFVRKTAAVWEITRLREDPEHFSESLRTWVKYIKAELGTAADRMAMQDIYSLACDRMIAEVFTEALTWSDICERLTMLQKVVADAQRAGRPVASDSKCRLAFQALYAYATKALPKHLAYLRIGIPALSALQQMCDVQSHIAKSNAEYSLDMVHDLSTVALDPSAPAAAHRTFRACKALTSDYDRAAYGIHNLVQEPQAILDKDVEAATYITEWSQVHFTSLATLVEIQAQMGLDQPLYSLSDFSHAAAAEKGVSNRLQITEWYRYAILGYCANNAFSPDDERLQYPPKGKCTATNLAQMQAAEAVLGSWFDKLDAALGLLEGAVTYVGQSVVAGWNLPPVFEELMREKGRLYHPSMDLEEEDLLQSQSEDEATLGLEELNVSSSVPKEANDGSLWQELSQQSKTGILKEPQNPSEEQHSRP